MVLNILTCVYYFVKLPLYLQLVSTHGDIRVKFYTYILKQNSTKIFLDVISVSSFHTNEVARLFYNSNYSRTC